MADTTPTELTRDAVLNGALTLFQPRAGYRFAVDALLLADFAPVAPGRTVLDLGSGVGVIALVLARKMASGRVLAVEVQPRLAECARLNARSNPEGRLVQVLEMDWNALTPAHCGGPVDLIVCNPPYRELGSGRVNPEEEQAVARHEFRGSAASAAKTAARLLAPGGRLAVIYPAVRLVSLMAALRAAGLEPKRLRMVHSRAGEKARLVLLEARLGSGEELDVMPPLYVYGPGRDYTDEVRAMLSGNFFGATGEPPDFS